MKLDQIAYYAHNEDQVRQIKEELGLLDADWVEDIVIGGVHLPGDTAGMSAGHLRFNYDTGIEIEILTYLDGPHWHMNKPEFQKGEIFISHFGFHMDDGEDCPWLGERPAQVMDTIAHTNPYLIENGRKYHYEIYGRPGAVDLKYIWRVQNG